MQTKNRCNEEVPYIKGSVMCTRPANHLGKHTWSYIYPSKIITLIDKNRVITQVGAFKNFGDFGGYMSRDNLGGYYPPMLST